MTQPIPIQLGTQLQIQIRQRAGRTPARLIGLEHGKYVIVSAPAVLSSDLNTIFAPGRQVIVRYLHEGTALGFQTTVLNVIMKPFRLVFLHYPAKTEDMNLRKHPRNECYLPSEVEIGGDTGNGVVVDLSKGGCCFTCKSITQFGMDALNIGNEAEVRIALPGIEGKLGIKAILRNVRSDQDCATFGLQFTDMEPHTEEKLLAFIDEIQAFGTT